MIAAILVFFLAIFFGFALLSVTTYLYSRHLKRKQIKHFSSSGDYAAVHSSQDTDKYLDNDSVSSYIYTPGGYIEEEIRKEPDEFIPLSENLTENANYSSSSSDYSNSGSSLSYDSSSSSSDYSSSSDSGSSSSSSD